MFSISNRCACLWSMVWHLDACTQCTHQIRLVTVSLPSYLMTGPRSAPLLYTQKINCSLFWTVVTPLCCASLPTFSSDLSVLRYPTILHLPLPQPFPASRVHYSTFRYAVLIIFYLKNREKALRNYFSLQEPTIVPRGGQSWEQELNSGAGKNSVTWAITAAS